MSHPQQNEQSADQSQAPTVPAPTLVESMRRPMHQLQLGGSQVVSTPSQPLIFGSEYQGNPTRQMNIPWYLWGIIVIELIIGAYFATIMILNESEKKSANRQVIWGKSVLQFLRMAFSFLGNIFPSLLATVLFCGLLTANETKKIICLQCWVQGAFFIIQGNSIFVYLTFAELSEIIDVDEETTWKHLRPFLELSVSIIFHTFAAILVKKYLAKLENPPQGEQSRYVVLPRLLHQELYRL